MGRVRGGTVGGGKKKRRERYGSKEMERGRKSEQVWISLGVWGVTGGDTDDDDVGETGGGERHV